MKMDVSELKGIISRKLEIPISDIGREDFREYGVRFRYLGSSYRATTDLAVEKVEGGCLVTDDDARRIEKLLRTEEWDGEGLPPVGVECEMSYAGDEWHKCVIIAKGEEQIIYQTQGCREFSGHRDNYRFRPIRSEADKKKEAVEKAIADALFRDGDFDYVEALRLSTFVYGAISRNEIPHVSTD
jgi:hypothetical protein